MMKERIKKSGIDYVLVGYDTYGLTVETCETDNDVLCIVFLDFEEFAAVYDRTDYFVHIVWFVGAVRDNIVQRIFQTVDWI